MSLELAKARCELAKLRLELSEARHELTTTHHEEAMVAMAAATATQLATLGAVLESAIRKITLRRG